MDPNNPVVKLCIEGTRAEYDGRPDDARALYARAWELARDDYEACIAAHYVARFQDSPAESLRWNQEALQRAAAAEPDLVQDFYPSLYLNMGRSYELLGDEQSARRYYDLAAGLGFAHEPEED